jgi:hypothetical protein
MADLAMSKRFLGEGRLGRLSTFMCLAVAVGGALAELALIWVWLSPSLVEAYVTPRLGLGDVPANTDGARRLAGFCISMIPMLVLFLMLDQAYRLFDAFRQGQTFPDDGPMRLHRIGKCMIAIALLRPLALMLLALALTIGNPEGQVIVAIGLTIDDYMIALFGGLVLAIGHVMMEGKRISDENREFI